MEPVSLLLTTVGAGIAALAAVAFLGVGASRLQLRLALEPNLRVAWRAAAKRTNLTMVEEARTLAALPWLTARSGQFGVRLEKVRLDGKVATRIEVSGLGHGREGLTARREEPDSGLAWLLAAGAIELGDPGFDREFRVEGQEALALAVLDHETRWALADLLRGFVFVEGRKPIEVSATLAADRLEVRVSHDPRKMQHSLSKQVFEALQAALRLARRLALPQDLAGRLAGNLHDEPEAGVRLRTLQVLRREFPPHQHPAARDALVAACEDASDRMRLEGGIGLGKEGRATLRKLVADAAISEDCAARAVEELGAGLSVEEAAAALRQALGRGRDVVARACLETLDRHGRLGRRGDAEVESLLVETLSHKDSAVSLAAARTLGPMGTAAAVPALRQLEERGSRELSRSARLAIAEIQSRLTGAEHGQLSLADAEAGALSLATEAEPGRLSLAEEEPAAIEHQEPGGRPLGRS